MKSGSLAAQHPATKLTNWRRLSCARCQVKMVIKTDPHLGHHIHPGYHIATGEHFFEPCSEAWPSPFPPSKCLPKQLPRMQRSAAGPTISTRGMTADGIVAPARREIPHGASERTMSIANAPAGTYVRYWTTKARAEETERRVMKFSTYAEVFTPDHPLHEIYEGGFKKTPGYLLQDILRETGGVYEVSTELPQRVREEVRRMARLTSDAKLAAVADTESIRISLEHLRGHDPSSTRIVYGCQIDREPGDGDLPGLDLPGRE